MLTKFKLCSVCMSVEFCEDASGLLDVSHQIESISKSERFALRKTNAFPFKHFLHAQPFLRDL